jgi:UDP-glucose:glycoprotein glucosyltransferase
VRKNLFSVVLAVDVTDPTAINVLAEEINLFVARGIPLRFGLLPIHSKDATQDSLDAIKMCYYLFDEHGVDTLFAFYTDLNKQLKETSKQPLEVFKAVFEDTIRDKQPKTDSAPTTYQDIVAEMSDYSTMIQPVQAATKRLGLTTNSMFMNGKLVPLEAVRCLGMYHVVRITK